MTPEEQRDLDVSLDNIWGTEVSKEDLELLYRIYRVSTPTALIQAQAHHIEKLQSKLKEVSSVSYEYYPGVRQG